jgi:membrane-associated phospholipid phosphatase
VFLVEALWLRIYDRLSKVIFAVVAGMVLIIELWVNHLDRIYALLLCGCVGFIATTVMNALIKHMLKKERPVGEIKRTRNLLAPLMQYSFPSFHTQLAFTMITVASWFFFSIHWGFVIFFVLLAMLTAYSRHALKANDIVDLIGGAIIGTVVGVLVCLLLSQVNNVYLSLFFLVLMLALFLYIPERYFSKNILGKRP